MALDTGRPAIAGANSRKKQEEPRSQPRQRKRRRHLLALSLPLLAVGLVALALRRSTRIGPRQGRDARAQGSIEYALLAGLLAAGIATTSFFYGGALVNMATNMSHCIDFDRTTPCNSTGAVRTDAPPPAASPGAASPTPAVNTPPPASSATASPSP